MCRRLRDARSSDTAAQTPAANIVATALTQQFHGLSFEFPPGEEREVIAQVTVPKEECWTKRRGTLFELDVFVRVEMDSSYLS